MTRYLSILLLATPLLYSCKKPAENPTTNANTVLTMKPFDSLVIPTVLEDKGTKPISVHIEDYPWQHMKYEIYTTSQTDNNPLYREVLLVTKNAPIAQHRMKLVTAYSYTGDNIDVKTFDVHIAPFTPTECASTFFKFLPQSSSNTHQEQGATVLYLGSHRVAKKGDALYLKALKLEEGIIYPNAPWANVYTYTDLDQLVTITIDCTTQKITLPEQNVISNHGDHYKVVGAGTLDFATGKYEVHYTANGEPFQFSGVLWTR